MESSQSALRHTNPNPHSVVLQEPDESLLLDTVTNSFCVPLGPLWLLTAYATKGPSMTVNV